MGASKIGEARGFFIVTSSVLEENGVSENGVRMRDGEWDGDVCDVIGSDVMYGMWLVDRLRFLEKSVGLGP